MRTEGVDPRDIQWESDMPVYRVYFWHRPPPPPGVSVNQMGWSCHEYRLIDAVDVHEVIAWADERLPEGDHYVLYVEQSDGGPGLVRLAGVDPTAPTDGDGDVITVHFPG